MMNDYSDLACKRCGVVGQWREKLMEEKSPHYGKLECIECGSFGRWLPKPKNECKRQSCSVTARSLGINYCQICLREESELGAYEFLHAHHIIDAHKGGGDERENLIVVCTFCHDHIHSVRNMFLNLPKKAITYQEMIKLCNFNNVTGKAKDSLMELFIAANRDNNKESFNV